MPDAPVIPYASRPPRKDRADVFFQTDHLRSELKRRTARGGAVTMASQAAKFVLTLGSSVLLFRIGKLGRAEAGLVAMVVAITGVVNLFKDLGLSRATVQKDNITREETSSLFWVNAGIGLLAMLLTFALAPAIAAFYGKPELVKITLVLGTAFLFSGVAVQHQALLQRQMQFATIAVVDLASLLVGIAVGTVLVLNGFGYWSLVWMQVAMAIANSIGTWLACPWRPGLPARGVDIRGQLRFGGNLAGFNILNYLQRNADNVIVGRFLGEMALGGYQKAYSLLMLPINQINTPMSNVAVPALSRLQKEPDRYRGYYRKAIELISAISMPIVAMLFVLADDLVLTFLGPDFKSAVPIFRWLVPAAYIGTFNVATGWVYTSLGRTDRQLRMGLVVTPITLLGFFLGAWLGGALGVAISFSATQVLLRYPTILYCFRGTPLAPRDLFAAIARPSAAALIAGAGLFFIDRWLDPHLRYAVLRLGIGAAIYSAIYLLAWLVLPGGREFIRHSGGLLKELTGKKNGGGSPKPVTVAEPVKKAAPDEPLPEPATTVKVA